MSGGGEAWIGGRAGPVWGDRETRRAHRRWRLLFHSHASAPATATDHDLPTPPPLCRAVGHGQWVGNPRRGGRRCPHTRRGTPRGEADARARPRDSPADGARHAGRPTPRPWRRRPRHGRRHRHRRARRDSRCGPRAGPRPQTREIRRRAAVRPVRVRPPPLLLFPPLPHLVNPGVHAVDGRVGQLGARPPLPRPQHDGALAAGDAPHLLVIG